MPPRTQPRSPGAIFVLLLAVAEQPVLAGMRIDAAHRDPRPLDAGRTRAS